MDRKTLVDLECEHSVDYQINYLIRIIDINRGKNVRRLRVVLSWADRKRCLWIRLGNQGSQLLDRPAPARIKGCLVCARFLLAAHQP